MKILLRKYAVDKLLNGNPREQIAARIEIEDAVNSQSGVDQMMVYKTREEAVKAAVEEFGHLAVSTQTINVVKIGPMIAKYLQCEEGYSIESIEQDGVMVK